jgi:tetratricopeptide (TPR) repeat protein
MSPSALSESTIQDPIEISRRADEFFANKQYDGAANLYEQLLVLNPNNADTYNNLGLTLHYLGRSAEALSRLNEGVALDVENQRIWLTLGYVNSQLGNTEQARKALTTAAQIGNDASIRQSALNMLEALP